MTLICSLLVAQTLREFVNLVVTWAPGVRLMSIKGWIDMIIHKHSWWENSLNFFKSTKIPSSQESKTCKTFWSLTVKHLQLVNYKMMLWFVSHRFTLISKNCWHDDSWWSLVQPVQFFFKTQQATIFICNCKKNDA